MKQIISFIGKQGSGKTTVGTAIAELNGVSHIEASSVVRALHGIDMPREELHKTNAQTADNPAWLGDAIHDIMGDQKVVVLTGAREWEVHTTLRGKHNCNVFTVQCYAPPKVRLERLASIGKAPSYEYFLAQDEAEDKIGLKKLCQQDTFYILNTNGQSISSSVDEIDKVLGSAIKWT